MSIFEVESILAVALCLPSIWILCKLSASTETMPIVSRYSAAGMMLVAIAYGVAIGLHRRPAEILFAVVPMTAAALAYIRANARLGRKMREIGHMIAEIRRGNFPPGSPFRK